ncbi:MAG: hypothetical protein OXU86_05285 [Thaumarchaeota archaeon]|nr:hypothetical protein [Nitrososphaerota archaeon]RNJ71292.1 MAG: hypothetical protein EB832_06365 [Thaumarchaeota archaeon S14]RNJ73696.1 MAG: hypothetical protein EB833_02215 [Thaumarchaeota archaeon S13]RNJ75462.1 MAG: hypothetical protein EB824_01545 [Thaumarchaeota archaeon S15]MDD9808323.1 hypothetical protein [Nitrososphaerota archaeon]
MATYSGQVAELHRRYNAAAKKAGSGKTLLKAFRAHKKAHERILKRHLAEELADAKKKGRALDKKK